MDYAVFDWDNTIRKGFTLFQWMDFLYREKALNPSVDQKITEIQSQYANHQITHDEYARKAGIIYAAAMKGMHETHRQNLVARYMKEDRPKLHPFVPELFAWLKAKNIQPVIVSGAPAYIIEEYRQTLGISAIYAFQEEYENGICTGQVACNSGYNKQSIMNFLYQSYGRRPLFGFGDSKSDLPIFHMAKVGICICKPGESGKKFGDDLVYINNEASGSEVTKLMACTNHLT